MRRTHNRLEAVQRALRPTHGCCGQAASWQDGCAKLHSRRIQPFSSLQSGSDRTAQALRHKLAPSNRSNRRSYSVTAPRSLGQKASFSVPLVHRGLVAVVGQDAAKFLQGLTTNNIPFDPPVESEQLPVAQCNAFLNAQGRLLQDALIYTVQPQSKLIQSLAIEDPKAFASSNEPCFLIEVDRAQVPSLLKTLKRYKLRAKLALREVNAQQLGVVFHSDNNSTILDIVKQQHLFCARDERAPGLGLRILASPDELGAVDTGQSGTIDDYRIHRYLQGVPEGQDELPAEHAMVQESNLDLMSGVDFRKGCYVGQELVIRTQHTGVVRKRVLPVLLYANDTSPPERLAEAIESSTQITVQYGTDIKSLDEANAAGRRSRSAGKWIANVGNLGLALARLEAMAGLGPTGQHIEGWQSPEFALDIGTGDNASPRVKAFVPDWWANRQNF